VTATARILGVEQRGYSHETVSRRLEHTKKKLDMKSSLQRLLLSSLLLVGLILSPDIAQSAQAPPPGGASAAAAREAMISIFDRKDLSAIDRFFANQFVQHDPNISDGLVGLRQYAAEIAASPGAKIKIYRSLEDGDLVLLHSKYEGLSGQLASLIAFDLFRFKDGKIVELGADKSRNRRLIRRDTLRSMGRRTLQIVTRPKKTGIWCVPSRRR
jgi:predicted SnoaL-like aldol condensation-catalyzing enzyme